MLSQALLNTAVPPLQHYPWPPVNPADALPPDLCAFLTLDLPQQRQTLAALRRTPAQHGRMLHEGLATCFSARYGYADSPCFQRLDAALEVQLMQAELALGDELLCQGLDPMPIPQIATQAEAAAYLHTLAQHNPGVTHPLFDYLATAAARPALETMLLLETLRNEVVDDEVARLAIGLQGLMKAVAASNLWDECGHGKPVGFHTYWLRRLLAHRNAWDALAAYRARAPWFTRIASNTFNVLLWRPTYVYRKYGFFLITESWVAPHFSRLLAGLQRVGLAQQDVTVYFEAHLTIDPHHGAELLTGLSQHAPALGPWEIDEVLRGAHLAIAAYVMQCDAVLPYLVQMA